MFEGKMENMSIKNASPPLTSSNYHKTVKTMEEIINILLKKKTI